MKYIEYKIKFTQKAKNRGIPSVEISKMLDYAKNLMQNDVPIIFDNHHISSLLGYDLLFIISITNSAHTNYKKYKIPKKNGGFRIIHEPLPSLKEMQTWILKNILTPASKKYVSPIAKAYMPKLNLKDNARFHKNQKKVLTLDLVNFFGSVNYIHVYTIFRKFGYSKSVSTLLSNLLIRNNSLPQGAPTSPMISNLVFKFYDDKIFEFCTKNKIRYTRYSDDLAFSGNFNIGEVIFFLKKLFKGTAFRINDKKTKIASQARRQEITGIVVNKRIQVPKNYRKKIRQELYYIVKFGLEKHIENIKWDKTVVQYIYHLLGKVNFVLQINPKDCDANKYKEFLKEILQQYK